MHDCLFYLFANLCIGAFFFLVNPTLYVTFLEDVDKKEKKKSQTDKHIPDTSVATEAEIKEPPYFNTVSYGVCSREGCGQSATKVRCGTCHEQGLPLTYFCTEDCFHKAWDAHSKSHKPVSSEEAALQRLSSVQTSFELLEC
jgi:hypothetical protein